MRTIAFSTKHITNAGNNQFRYNFPRDIDLTNKQIGLASLSMYYSFYNVSAAKNNNKVSYIWNGTTYTITFPDMIAEVSDLQAFMFFTFRQSNHYLNDVNGNPVYPIEMFVDSARYAIVVVVRAIPAAANTTYPADKNTHFTFPSSAFVPRLIMVGNNAFHKLIGYTSDFDTGVLNAASVSTSTSFSSVSPLLNPDANLMVNIQNIINNPYADPNGICHAFGVNVSPGSQLVERPNEIAFVDVVSGKYDHIDLRIMNSDTLADVLIRDPEINILLIIRDKP